MTVWTRSIFSLFHECLLEDLWRFGWGASPQVTRWVPQTTSVSDVRSNVKMFLGVKGGAQAEQTRCILSGCSSVALTSLLWSDYFKACLQHRTLLDGFSWKVVVSMYIFTLQSRKLQLCASSGQSPYTKLPAVGYSHMAVRFLWCKGEVHFMCWTCVNETFTLAEVSVHMTCRNFSGHGQGRVHPWMSHQPIAGPYLSIWRFGTLLKGNLAVLCGCTGISPCYLHMFHMNFKRSRTLFPNSVQDLPSVFPSCTSFFFWLLAWHAQHWK